MEQAITIKQANAVTLNADYFGRFIAYLDASPKTIATYSRALKQFAKWLNDKGITQPARADILAYREELKQTRKAATVQMYITVVRLFFKWLDSEGIYKDIAAHIKGAKLTTEHKKDALTAEQAREVLALLQAQTDTAEGKRNFAILRLMLTAGLRTIEVSRANIEDLRNIGGQVVLFVQGKGQSDRADFVKIPANVDKAIRAYLATRGKIAGNAPLFASASNNSKGSRLSTRSISGIAKAAFMAAGYISDRLTAHSTRHTAVTLALQGGATLQQAQQFARHSKITTTQIYAHNLDRINNPCEALIENAVNL